MRDRGIKNLLVAALVGIASMGSAQSATVTVGSFTFDDSAYADTISVVSGPVFFPMNIVDGVLSTDAFINSDDEIEVGFNNAFGNGAGIDILVFEAASDVENLRLSLSSGGESIAGMFQETVTPASGQINIFGFDLSDLGITAGAVVTDNLFFTVFTDEFGATNSPDIAEIAAINTGTTVVPLPAALPLFAGGLGLLGLLGWRRKRAATA